MKVLIKGAGDIATGIAARLFRCGFTVLMTEIQNPTTVRRTVAFSEAVYEKTVRVEGIQAVVCNNMAEIKEATASGAVAVVVDEECRVNNEWKPDVVVDSILAKRNLGTSVGDAGLVIGVGPGFTAGVDCHCVVETKRGHDLGRCIWSGQASPDTRIPGDICGYGVERLIRASSDGIFKAEVSIGTIVRAGDVVGYAGDLPVTAQIGGMVRGLLKSGIAVKKGMKAGDVDPRGEEANCLTISDKARAVGGGVLEAILSAKAGTRG